MKGRLLVFEGMNVLATPMCDTACYVSHLERGKTS